MEIECNTRGLLTVFFRQKLKFLLVFSLIVAAGGYYLATAKPVYEANASLLVKFGQGALPDLNRPESKVVGNSDQSERSQIMESHVKILTSSDLLKDVVTIFGVQKLYPNLTEKPDSPLSPEQIAINILQYNDLDIRTSDKGNLININVRNGDPAIAAEFSKLLIEKFLVRQAEVFNAPRTGFLQQQIDEAKQKLEVSQQEFQDFKTDVKISSFDEEMNQLIAEKGTLSGYAFQAVTQAQTILSDLETKEADMRATYRSDSPMVKRLHDSIATAREQLQARQADLNTAGDEGDSSLSAKIASINERMAFLESQRSRYKELEQRLKMDQDNYEYYQKRGEEARVNDMLNQENITRISVVDQPSALNVPVRPRKFIILMATLMAAGLFGLGIALTFEILDDRLTSPQQVTAALRLPVLASFDRLGKAGV